MTPSIYITYNKKSNNHIEESTALRLQTLSNLYGLNVILPYRPDLAFNRDSESANRITNSSYVVVFSMTPLTTRLQNEIKFAVARGKPIIIVYDKNNGKNIYHNERKIKEVSLDTKKPEDTISEIAEYLNTATKFKNNQVSRDQENGVGIALIGIGLGLLALSLIANNDK